MPILVSHDQEIYRYSDYVVSEDFDYSNSYLQDLPETEIIAMAQKRSQETALDAPDPKKVHFSGVAQGTWPPPPPYTSSAKTYSEKVRNVLSKPFQCNKQETKNKKPVKDTGKKPNLAQSFEFWGQASEIPWQPNQQYTMSGALLPAADQAASAPSAAPAVLPTPITAPASLPLTVTPPNPTISSQILPNPPLLLDGSCTNEFHEGINAALEANWLEYYKNKHDETEKKRKEAASLPKAEKAVSKPPECIICGWTEEMRTVPEIGVLCLHCILHHCGAQFAQVAREG